jgi:hypothetical protein
MSPQRALDLLSLALDSGYRCHHALLHTQWLDSLRPHPRFAELVNRAAALDLEDQTVFMDNRGHGLLGVQVDGELPEPAPTCNEKRSMQ